MLFLWPFLHSYLNEEPQRVRLCERQAGGPREVLGAWTPECDLGMPGPPNVQKQVEETRISLTSLDRDSKLNSMGALGRAGGLESPNGKNWGDTRWQNSVRETGQDLQASWMHARPLGLGLAVPCEPPLKGLQQTSV